MEEDDFHWAFKPNKRSSKIMSVIPTRLWYEGVVDEFLKLRREGHATHMKKMGVILSKSDHVVVDRTFAKAREEMLSWTIEEAADHFCGRRTIKASKEAQYAALELIALTQVLGHNIGYETKKTKARRKK